MLGFTLLALALSGGAGVVLWQAVEVSSLAQAAARVDDWKPVAAATRIALIGALVAGWPTLVRLRALPETRREYLLGQRWRVAAWLLLIELVLGQGLPQRLVGPWR